MLVFAAVIRGEREFMPIGRPSLQWLWLKALLFVLFGLSLLGKGFAYLFLGEMVLALGFLIFLQSRRVMLAFADPVLLLWVIFAFWGFCRTVPFLSKYGIDAIRDSVLWSYGVFALLIVAFVNDSSQISRALNTYRKVLRWYLPMVPILLIVGVWFVEEIPTLPWGDHIRIIWLKPGEAAVHLAGTAVFGLLFRERRAGSQKRDLSIFGFVRFAGWSLAALIAMFGTRGGLIAVLVPLMVVSAVRVRSVGVKVVALATIVIFLALPILELNLIKVKIGGRRTFSSDQLVKNIESIVVTKGSSSSGLEATKAWRLIWWQKIIRYTVFGPYRWTGKGFGVNLAAQDGPPGITSEDYALRSPHNGSMTVLARMGVPGILIWAALNFVFAFRLILGYRRATLSGSRFWSALDLWILCYWLASLIYSCFDVYLESPQGGIWFWSIIGFGVAALRVQAYEARQLKSRMKVDEAFIVEPLLASA